MIRRLALPLILLSVAVGATWQARVTDAAADLPPDPPGSPVPATVSTPLFSARRVPLFLQAPEADRRLVADLDAVVADLPSRTCVAVTEYGRLLYGHNESEPLIPASTQKLLTGVAALELLGPDHVFTTRVVARVAAVDGVVDGDIWLVGGGDPLLMTMGYVGRFDDRMSYTDVGHLAGQMAVAGLTEVTGAVIGDESRFDSLRYVVTWPERFRPGSQNQAGPLSALSVNDGFVWWHAVNTSNGLSTSAADPAAFAAGLFDDLLEAREILIRRPPQSGIAPLDATVELARIDSPPLNEIVAQMLMTSDNTTAELLLKAMGGVASPPGTSQAGAASVMTALKGAGHDLTGVVTADGSGLDPGNRVTCRVLTAMLEDPVHGPDLVDGMAVAGESGTMRGRLAGSSAEGRVRAKTGTLRDVASLAGQVETLEGRKLSFAVLTNAEPLPDRVRRLHDRVALELVDYPSGPNLRLLEPLAVGGEERG